MHLVKRSLNAFARCDLKILHSVQFRHLSTINYSKFHINFVRGGSGYSQPILSTPKNQELLPIKEPEAMAVNLGESFLTTEEVQEMKKYDIDLLVASLSSLLNTEGAEFEKNILTALENVTHLVSEDDVMQTEFGKREVCELIVHFTLGYAMQMQVGSKVATPQSLPLIYEGLTALNYLCNHSNLSSAINHVNIKRLHDCRVMYGKWCCLLIMLCAYSLINVLYVYYFVNISVYAYFFFFFSSHRQCPATRILYVRQRHRLCSPALDQITSHQLSHYRGGAGEDCAGDRQGDGAPRYGPSVFDTHDGDAVCDDR
jgi:hypothetical protein